MSTNRGTTYAISATATGSEIAANPNRRSITIQNANASGAHSVYVFLGALADATVAASYLLVPGASKEIEGYLGKLAVRCAAAETADVRVLWVGIA